MVSSRSLTLTSGRRVFLIEAGDGPPLVLLHGSSTSSLSHLPLLERVEGARMVAVDRPGFGLSDPVDVSRDRFRSAAVDFIDDVLDASGLETTAIGGSSMGGTWALWYALARPERVHKLVLIGASPLLPGTRMPPMLRLMVAPVLGDLMSRAVKPDERMVVRFMSSMGEKETIARHPDLIAALVAAGRDRIATTTNLAELRAIGTPLGFRGPLMTTPDELRGLRTPTLIVWGDHDPVGSVAVAQAAAALPHDARLEILPAGHVPWLANPDAVPSMVSRFVAT